MSLESKSKALLDRALMLKKVRSFFDARGVIEVDTPILIEFPNNDAYIDPVIGFDGRQQRYLHTSPEFGMKRLLAALKRDIYELSHVFRAQEIGSKHNPEFMMIEWYRIGFSLDQLIQETLDLIFLFVPTCQVTTLSYTEAFKKFTGVSLEGATPESLRECLIKNNIEPPHNATFEELTHFVFGSCVEPKFKDVTVIKGFPENQAALAKIKIIDGKLQAMRFEIYYNSFELANGYDELKDPKEQRKRFDTWNNERIESGKPILPVDPRFLKILEELPECSGVATGFDRLMMCRHSATHIKQVTPFSYDEI